MKSCLVITGGEWSLIPNATEYDYIIACDKGVQYALIAGITPDLIIGDFDSIDDISIYEKEFPNSSIQTYPIRKDDTDTMLAVKHALSINCDKITIACGLGQRMDHTYANIQAMTYASQRGAVCEMVSNSEYIRTISPSDGAVKLLAKDNYSLSLFAISDTVKNVSIEGTEYDCITDIKNSFPLGHGNHFSNEYATISVEEGILLVIESKYQ